MCCYLTSQRHQTYILCQQAVLYSVVEGGSTDVFWKLGYSYHLWATVFGLTWSHRIWQQDLRPEDFAWMTEQIMGVANICCNGKIVSVLEGGYGAPTLLLCFGSCFGFRLCFGFGLRCPFVGHLLIYHFYFYL